MPIAKSDFEMSPERRRRAAAIILARGVLRYHRRIVRMKSGQTENSPDSSQNGLEVFGETRLSVSQCSGG